MFFLSAQYQLLLQCFRNSESTFLSREYLLCSLLYAPYFQPISCISAKLGCVACFQIADANATISIHRCIMRTYIYIYMIMYVYNKCVLYMCIYIYIYIYTHIHRYSHVCPVVFVGSGLVRSVSITSNRKISNWASQILKANMSTANIYTYTPII